MSKTREHRFQQRLMQEQRDLMRAVSRTEHDSRSAGEAAVQDIGDQATNSYAKEFMFHISNAERNQLQLVNDALARLRGGGFGECIACGEELDPKRLAAAPWARNCIHGQEKAEQGAPAS